MREHSAVIVFTFVFVFVFSFYEVLCFSSRQNDPASFKSAGDASLLFITGESAPPKSNSNPLDPSRSNIDSNHRNIQPPLRDFVNTNVKLEISKSSQDPITPKVGITTPRVPLRNYMNPNIKPGVSGQTSHSTVQTTQKSVASNPKPTISNPGIRDYVNPNIKLNPALSPSSGSAQNTPLTPIRHSINTSPRLRDPFPTLRPVSRQTTTKSPQRDFVNPAIRPRDPFPALKPVGQVQPSSKVQQQTPASKSGLSYAQLASGGVTTAKPGITNTATDVKSPTGTSTDQGTERADDGPNDNELREFSEALLKKDVNNAFKHITLNIQGKTTSQSKNDEAPQRLLEINDAAYQIPTIAKIRPLYNNYILDVTQNEFVTPQEKAEENDLIETMITTPIMQYTRNFLIDKGKVSRDPKDFKDLLKTIWFSMYSRGMGRVGSSGFEHIFLAEIKKDEVSGLHNWLYFHEVEENNLANYLGYMKKIDLGDKGAILKFHFTLDGKDKPVSSIFVGTSPELEMALYTTCYMFRANRICPLRLNGKNFIVRAYANKYRGKNILGSAFPEI